MSSVDFWTVTGLLERIKKAGRGKRPRFSHQIAGTGSSEEVWPRLPPHAHRQGEWLDLCLHHRLRSCEPRRPAHGAKGLCTASSVTRTQGIRMSIFNSHILAEKTNPSHAFRSLSGGLAEPFGNCLLPEAAPALMALPLPGRARRDGASCPDVWLSLCCPCQIAVSWWTQLSRILQPVTARRGHQQC